MVEYREPDLLARNPWAQFAHRLFYLDCERFDLFLVDGPVLAGCSHPCHDLRPLEGDELARSLQHEDDRFGGPLVSCEALPASDALATPTNRLALFDLPRIDDAVLQRCAPRAPHTPTVHRLARQLCSTRARRPNDRESAQRGRTRRSPGRRTLPPSCTSSSPTSGLGSAPGSTRLAIDHRVSPGLAT